MCGKCESCTCEEEDKYKEQLIQDIEVLISSFSKSELEEVCQFIADIMFPEK